MVVLWVQQHDPYGSIEMRCSEDQCLDEYLFLRLEHKSNTVFELCEFLKQGLKGIASD